MVIMRLSLPVSSGFPSPNCLRALKTQLAGSVDAQSGALRDGAELMLSHIPRKWRLVGEPGISCKKITSSKFEQLVVYLRKQ